MISKIQIKRIDGSVIFEYETEDNSVEKTVLEYIRREKSSGKKRVDLRGVDLVGAVLNFHDLSNIDLIGANLGYVNLGYCILTGCDLKSANLSYAKLNNTYLEDANLSYANLSYANLRFIKLDNSKLLNTILFKADLSNADLYNTDLRYADLSFADLSNADLSNADLKYTKLIETVMLNVKNILYATCGFVGNKQLLGIKIDGKIRFFCSNFNGTEKELKLRIKLGDDVFRKSRLLSLKTVKKLIKYNEKVWYV